MAAMFVDAFARDLETTQRAIPSNCLFCVPQPRSLVADDALTQDALYTHFLTPAGTATDAHARHPGEYDTLNGKTVAIVGSHIHTGKGFEEPRKVRILLSERKEIGHQLVMVLHLSQPLVGGIAVPEDPNEIDVATFRRYTAILRAFPENELVFYHLDETIAQVKKICTHNQFFNRYEQTLPSLLKEEWEAAVEEILQCGSFDDSEDDDDALGNGGGKQQQYASHLLQIQQVVECYLMEQLHEFIFPRVVISCQEQEETLSNVLYKMRHYTPEDFGIRKAFQCYAHEARNTLLDVHDRKTPLDMLLAFKSCIDKINDAIERSLRQHNLDFGNGEDADARKDRAASPQEAQGSATAKFPIAAVLQYISDYHFINSNTTALGFTIANFQVAIEYFLLRASHVDACRTCQNGSIGPLGERLFDNESCSQGILLSKSELAHARNVDGVRETKEKISMPRAVSSDHSTSSESVASNDPAQTSTQLMVIGDWSSSSAEDYEVVEMTESSPSFRTQKVNFEPEGSKLVQISGGQRFFAVVTDQGKLYTWGDRSGGRLGYPSAAGDSRRVDHPQRVTALDHMHVVHVACGAFHTLATDVNGHVYAWGSNARGQLGFLTHATATTTVEAPTLVTDLRGTYMSSVACGEYHSLGLSSDGQVFSWGCNKYSKLGRITESFADAVALTFCAGVFIFLPVKQPKVLDEAWTGIALDLKTPRSLDDPSKKGLVRRIAAGKDHSLAISWDGAVFTWGRGDSGQLGHGCFMDVAYPKQVMALSWTRNSCDGFSMMDAAAGNDFSLFLADTGVAFLSGRDPALVVPDSERYKLSPELVPLPSNVQECANQIVGISCGEAHYGLQLANGTLLLSSNTRINSNYDEDNDDPDDAERDLSASRRVAVVESVANIKQMACGASHTLVLV
ncbi:Rcc1 domain containing protein, partial [Globisporangium splendens]